jgi:REP element-mobilizing transposase RayT
MPDHVHLLLSEPQSERGQQPKGGPLKPVFGLSGDVHWLSNPQQHTLADAIKSLKQGVSRRLIGNLPLKLRRLRGVQAASRNPEPVEGRTAQNGPPEHFWQKRYYDLNIRNYAQFVEKLRYIHRNPVRAGLCERPGDWQWSRFAITQPVLKDE